MIYVKFSGNSKSTFSFSFYIFFFLKKKINLKAS